MPRNSLYYLDYAIARFRETSRLFKERPIPYGSISPPSSLFFNTYGHSKSNMAFNTTLVCRSIKIRGRPS
jgi:hypothetical protein